MERVHEIFKDLLHLPMGQAGHNSQLRSFNLSAVSVGLWQVDLNAEDFLQVNT